MDKITLFEACQSAWSYVNDTTLCIHNVCGDYAVGEVKPYTGGNSCGYIAAIKGVKPSSTVEGAITNFIDVFKCMLEDNITQLKSQSSSYKNKINDIESEISDCENFLADLK